MIQKTKLFVFFLLVTNLFVLPVLAIDAWPENELALSGVEIVSTGGGVTLVSKDSKPKLQAVGTVYVMTTAQEVKVEAEDAKRNRLEVVEVTKPEDSPRKWVVYGNGQTWIRVDTKERVLDDEGRLVDILWETWNDDFVIGGTVPDDGDDDVDPPPNPPGPDDVPNEYKVGLVAYNAAPHDLPTIATMIDVYRKAGDFLFGKPSLKFIVSADEAKNKDPNRSVIAWIAQQRNQASSDKAWDVWASRIEQALIYSQGSREGGFTKNDWYNAFNEIADALEMVK